jgi:hypothetical protein
MISACCVSCLFFSFSMYSVSHERKLANSSSQNFLYTNRFNVRVTPHDILHLMLKYLRLFYPKDLAFKSRRGDPLP